MFKSIRMTLAALLALAGTAGGQAGTAAPPPACSAPEYRQFDFWAGSWDVQSPDGEPQGTNRIDKILGGCALQENWQGVEGSTGTSINAYNAADGQWHQHWVSSGGMVLDLAGTFADEKMILSGTRPAANDPTKIVHHRITWEKLSEDKVRQHWERSLDGGATWSTVFDGLYIRKK